MINQIIPPKKPDGIAMNILKKINLLVLIYGCNGYKFVHVYSRQKLTKIRLLHITVGLTNFVQKIYIYIKITSPCCGSHLHRQVLYLNIFKLYRRYIKCPH